MHTIHVRQDQSSHMHCLSEYQNKVSKCIESIKTLLRDRMSQNVTKASTSGGKERLHRQLTSGMFT
jgi:hypothetical protein